MAIKGKSKTKSRPRPAARAPRHEPVVVKPPLLARRWVQVAAALVAGVLIMLFVIWATNNVREERRTNAATAAAEKAGASKRSAGLAWQSQVEGAVSRLGTVNPSVTPDVFKSLNAAIDQMVKQGTVPAPARRIFQAGAKSAEKSVNALKNFDLATTIASKGFDVAEAEYFTESRDRLVAAIQTYQRAAEAAIIATQLEGTPHFKVQATLADHLRSDANAQFQTAWSTYQSALGSAGIAPKPPSTGIGGG
jgi:hypothetical protein